VEPLFRKVDCLSLKVADLDAALDFYGRKLGHPLLWRSKTAAGLQMPDSDAELVIHSDPVPTEPDLLVNSVPEAVERFQRAGGHLTKGPFEIAIGLYALVTDPWGNQIAMLDMSKGKLKVDRDKNVV